MFYDPHVEFICSLFLNKIKYFTFVVRSENLPKFYDYRSQSRYTYIIPSALLIILHWCLSESLLFKTIAMHYLIFNTVLAISLSGNSSGRQ